MEDTGTNLSQPDWVLVQRVERDICYLYHQLADYTTMMGDLCYGEVYTLPYWKFLEVEGIDDTRRAFIRDGCLVMILSMCVDYIGESGCYIVDHLSKCIRAVARVEPDDKQTVKLLETVQFFLRTVSGKERGFTSELDEMMSWVHKTYVRGYFGAVLEKLEREPYWDLKD